MALLSTQTSSSKILLKGKDSQSIGTESSEAFPKVTGFSSKRVWENVSLRAPVKIMKILVVNK